MPPTEGHEKEAAQIVRNYLLRRNERDGDVPAEAILEHEIAEAFAHLEATPCVVCNDRHKGATVESRGHAHQDREGVGNIRLVVIGGHSEFCFRCSCPKSGWVNRPNTIAHHCADGNCPCHRNQECY